MEVFLIPVGEDRHELYFEPGASDPAEVAADGGPRADRVPVLGWLLALRRRFREILREAEAERHRRRHEGPAAAQRGMAARARRRLLRWMAERIAEQRLLWHLRRTAHVRLHAPADLEPARAGQLVRDRLQRDADRHFRRLLLHSVGLAFAILLIPIPGPNLIGYYFTFTVVGHALSTRGARHGLRAVRWEVVPNADLVELRAALTLGPPQRERRIHAIAARLRLHHLATFFERVAVPTA